MEAIKIINLTKNYKNLTAVDNLNFSINDGELFALLGVNGAGKTTTIKMLCCTLSPTSGDAFIYGNSIIHDSAKVKSIIGVSPQETAIAPNLTVRENLMLMCGVHNFSKKKSIEKVNELVDMFDFHKIVKKQAKKLSGGWQRKLSLAMALIIQPKVLFLDEPTLGLDVIARNQLWNTIKQLKGKMTIILTTHYMEEAENLADNVAIMKDGVLLDAGGVEELKTRTNTTSLEQAFLAIIGEN